MERLNPHQDLDDEAGTVTEDVIRIEETLFSHDDGSNAPRELDLDYVCAQMEGEHRDLAMRVLKSVSGGKVPLPMLPKNAARALEVASNREASFQDFEEAIRPDPVMAAKLLKIANSPIYGVARTITSIRQAMLMLGTASLSQMVMQAVVESHAFGTQKDIRHLAQEHAHALAVAHFSQAIAAELGQGTPEAFLCGLLHDFGRMVLPGVFRNLSVELEPEQRQTMFDGLHGAIGHHVAMLWQLPLIVVNAASRHHDYRVKPPLRNYSMIGNLIAAGEILAHVHGFTNGETIADLSSLDAGIENHAVWRDLGLSEKLTNQVVAQAEKIAERLKKHDLAA